MKISIYLLVTLLLNCNIKPVNFEYKIPDSYNGLCVIFIYKEAKDIDSNNILINKHGLSRISESNVNKKFALTSAETKNEIPIIQIGDEKNAVDGKRNIFRLAKGFSSSNCDNNDINLISFYVGFKEDYLQWSNKYHDDFEYLDSIGVNWCSFYKQIN
jgi:hypothetical protein